MGLVLQNQRRALEGFHGHPLATLPPSLEDNTNITDTDGRPLHIAGVSVGIGTCADIKGLDVLVLSEHAPQTPFEGAGRLACAYTVLVREATQEELAADTFAVQGVARRCVELLAPIEAANAGSVAFARTQLAILYTAI